MNPKVSIIVPIYNVDKYLSKCLDSIQNQSFSNLEVILVDDGSTDNSYQIAQKYSKNDSRFIVLRQKNSGQSSARNAGLKKASGDYVSFIDGDDEVSPQFIASLLTPFQQSESNNPSLSVCGIHYKRLKEQSAKDVYIKPIRPIRSHESFKAYILRLLAIDGRMYSSVNKLYHASIAKTIKFDQTINFAEDTKFVLDYLQKAQGQISFVLKPLYIYNFGTDTSTIKTTATSWDNWQTSYLNLKSWLGPRPSIKERTWLKLVYLRWRISFIRSIKRAKTANQ